MDSVLKCEQITTPPKGLLSESALGGPLWVARGSRARSLARDRGPDRLTAGGKRRDDDGADQWSERPGPVKAVPYKSTA